MSQISPHFDREEFQCPDGCGFDTVDSKLIDILELLRQAFSSPVTITSGCRCDAHNKVVGGGKHSQHKLGRAADVVVEGVPATVVQEWFLDNYPFTFGMGRYEDFTHLDSRSGPPARWGKTL